MPGDELKWGSKEKGVKDVNAAYYEEQNKLPTALN